MGLDNTAGRDGSEAFLWPGVKDGSRGGDIECEGLRRKLIFVLLLLADIEIDGDAGGGMMLLRDRLGDEKDMVSGVDWAMGEYANRS